MKRLIKRLKKSNKLVRFLYYIITVLYLVGIVMFTKSLLNLTGIETILRIIVILVFIIYFIYYVLKNLLNLLKRKYKGLIVSSLFACIFVIIFYVGSYYINYVYNNLNSLQENSNITYTTYLVTKSDTSFSSKLNIGIISKSVDEDNYNLSQKLYKKNNLKNELVKYENYIKMINDLYSGEVDAIFLPSNYKTLFSGEEGFENIGIDTLEVYEYSEKKKNEDLDLVSNKDFSEPLTFLLLGVDSEGDGLNASASFNGDTLMVASFNPNTLDMILLSIPRDTYVPIACNNNKYAKINSSAAYGTSCVINTINNFLDLKIDYYVKINFKGVVDLVDAVDGISVEVEAPTYMANKYNGKVCEQNSDRKFGDKLVCMNPGVQNLNGEQALAYARCRHLYIGSDLDRVRHQQQVVEALANKVLHFSSIKEFQNILSAVSKNVATNMETDTILSGYSVAKNVLANMITGNDSLTIKKAVLETYSLPVYIPSQGIKTSAQGYYSDSLEDIKHAYNIILGKEKEEMIKTFSFSVNDDYEIKSPGKGKRSGASGKTLPSFVGKTLTEVKNYCNTNNIDLEIKYVDSDSKYYNSEVAVGLIGNQSVHEGVLLSNVKNLTVYIVNSEIKSNKKIDVKTEDKNETESKIEIDEIINGMLE